MIKKMDIEKFIYLKNSDGEDNDVSCPLDVEEWYRTLSISEDDWLLYLTEYNSKYGILAINEVIHPESATWDEDYEIEDKAWANMTAADIEEHLKSVADTIQSIIDNTVTLGLYTGCHEHHELGIWFPMETSDSKTISDTLNRIESVKIYM